MIPSLRLPVFLVAFFFFACKPGPSEKTTESTSTVDEPVVAPPLPSRNCTFTDSLGHPVMIGQWFKFLDSLAAHYDSLLPYPVTAYQILHANPWVMDTLSHSDYDYQLKRDSVVMDNRKWIVLRPGQRLCIPDSNEAKHLQGHLDSILLDVNIPEFRMRIMKGNDTLYSFPVRVGQVRVRHLDLAGGMTDLRTNIGEGHIVRIETNPYFLNPVDGKHFTTTKRDNGIRTEMPLIPWIEPEINKTRYGDMIHPTTNPITLGKAYSNGCVGTLEEDAWRVWYFAPVGTRVRIRYDLEQVQANGDTIHFKDVYNMRGRTTLPKLKAPKAKVDTVMGH